jgi:hypothetical protein
VGRQLRAPDEQRVAIRPHGRAGEIAHLGTRTYRDRDWDRYEIPLPGPFPLGYHTLHVAARRGKVVLQQAVALIVCPDRAYTAPETEGGDRAAGLGVALYGVRSGRNAGSGDFGDLRRLTRWATRALGVRFIGLNPLHAIHNRRPFNTSPYLPNSVFYRNPIYLDVERAAGFAESARAGRLFRDPQTQAELARLRSSEHIEYERVYSLKLRLLRQELDAAFVDAFEAVVGADCVRAIDSVYTPELTNRVPSDEAYATRDAVVEAMVRQLDRRGIRAFDEPLHVLLPDPPFGSGPREARKIDPQFTREFAHRRRGMGGLERFVVGRQCGRRCHRTRRARYCIARAGARRGRRGDGLRRGSGLRCGPRCRHRRGHARTDLRRLQRQDDDALGDPIAQLDLDVLDLARRR